MTVVFLLQGPAYGNKFSSDLPLRRVSCLPLYCYSEDQSFPGLTFKLYRSPHAEFTWQLSPTMIRL